MSDMTINTNNSINTSASATGAHHGILYLLFLLSQI